MWKKEIVNTIQKMSGKYTYQIIFKDWIEAFAVAIQNACWPFRDGIWSTREERHKSIMAKYDKNEQEKLADLGGMLALAYEEELGDLLGEIYMESGSGNKNTGQFFTPFHVSYLTAQLALNYEAGKKMTLNEPSCGGGGMIIATAKALKEKGIDYQRYMNVVAQDLDWTSVYMCYVQLSLLGICAVVIQGDTLQEPYHSDKNRVFYTPARMGVLL